MGSIFSNSHVDPLGEKISRNHKSELTKVEDICTHVSSVG